MITPSAEVSGAGVENRAMCTKRAGLGGRDSWEGATTTSCEMSDSRVDFTMITRSAVVVGAGVATRAMCTKGGWLRGIDWWDGATTIPCEMSDLRESWSVTTPSAELPGVGKRIRALCMNMTVSHGTWALRFRLIVPCKKYVCERAVSKVLMKVLIPCPFITCLHSKHETVRSSQDYHILLPSKHAEGRQPAVLCRW